MTLELLTCVHPRDLVLLSLLLMGRFNVFFFAVECEKPAPRGPGLRVCGPLGRELMSLAGGAAGGDAKGLGSGPCLGEGAWSRGDAGTALLSPGPASRPRTRRGLEPHSPGTARAPGALRRANTCSQEAVALIFTKGKREPICALPAIRDLSTLSHLHFPAHSSG